MSLQLIPTTSDGTAFYTQSVNLEGTSYGFTFLYNQREACWYLSIATDDGVPVVSGVKVVCNWPLLRRFADTRLPPGEILAVATGADRSPPGLGDMGEGLRVELTYFPSTDL